MDQELGRAARRRWLIDVTAAEATGYLAPALAGILATHAEWSEAHRAMAVIVAGLVEGFALGLGQAHAFPLTVRRLRYALLTALAAALVWALVLSMMALLPALPPPLALIAALLAGAGGLALIGGAQWIELRHHRPRAHAWIAWTALAWLVALPLSFAPGPLVDETTTLPVQVALWGLGGLAMAFVMAVITWIGVRRLVVPTAEAS